VRRSSSPTDHTLSSIGEGEDGTVYATSLANGELLRISASGD
jgi:hypothetical protein